MTLPDALEGTAATQERIDQFTVTLDVFEGPFDLLLQLISRRRLDITQVSMAEVTDEFIAHMLTFPDLSRTTEFLVVAAALLDMKAAHLLPRGEGDEDEDLAELETRDLLFSRLLQYRAFKKAATAISAVLDSHAGCYPRSVPLEVHFAALLPELVWRTSDEDLARAAVAAIYHAPETIQVAHLHDPTVPVRDQIGIVAGKIRRAGTLSFHDLVADATTRAVVVSRFLALLELYRKDLVEFAQEAALEDLNMTWTGGEENPDLDLDAAEYDEQEEANA